MDLEKVANQLTQMTEEGLSLVSSLSKEQIQLEEKIRGLEQEVKVTKIRLKEVSEDLLPSAMAEYNIKETTTSDNYNIKITDFYDARISTTDIEAREKAFNWLVENKFDYLIKNRIEILFPRKEDNKAKSLMAELREREMNASNKAWVEPQSLKAFVKEQIQKGEVSMPYDLLNIYEGRRAKITKK